MKFIATTCLLSESAKPRQKNRVLDFVGANTFVLAPETLIDIQRGIFRILQTNPQKAAELREWLSAMRENWPVLTGREQEKSRVLAAMLECKDLKTIWLPQPKAKYHGFGYHVCIAAMAIAYELPIAGFGVDPFLDIDRCFPLPGLFDLKVESWRSAAIEREADGRGLRTKEAPSNNMESSTVFEKRAA